MAYLLTWTGARWEVRCSSAESYKPKQAGFHHDYKQNCWWSGRQEIAKQFEIYADDRAKKRFAQAVEQVQLSKAVGIDDLNVDEYEIPCPKGLSYMPFQRAGIIVALSRLGFDVEKLKRKK